MDARKGWWSAFVSNFFSGVKDTDNDTGDFCIIRSEKPMMNSTLGKRQLSFCMDDSNKENSTPIRKDSRSGLGGPRSSKVFFPPKKVRVLDDTHCEKSVSQTTGNIFWDESKPLVLPVIESARIDINEISGSTLRDLLVGKYKDQINSYTIVDCRYPYEYEGGHIENALNLHTQVQVNNEFMKKRTAAGNGGKTLRNIVVLHCEFSSERGPNMYRYLREADRRKNMENYPFLDYPEMYVLKGGYEKFFQDHKEHCTPMEYRTMDDPEYKQKLDECSKKSLTELLIPVSSRQHKSKFSRRS